MEELYWIFKTSLSKMGLWIIYYEEFLKKKALLRYLFSKNEYNVSKLEIFRKILKLPQFISARTWVRKFEEEGQYLKYYLKGIKDPLYYPKDTFIYWIYVVISDILVKDSWDFYESRQTKVNKNDVVVDCGAAEGLFTLRVIGRCKKIYVIEPLPKFIQSLKKTLAHFKKAIIITKAVSNRSGEAIFKDVGLGSHLKKTGEGIKIEVTTIDELFYKRGIRIDFIKADLEGSDFDMLKGAKKTIEKWTPKISITTYHRKEHAVLMINFLKKINPRYTIKLKGLNPFFDCPVMLHAWLA